MSVRETIPVGNTLNTSLLFRCSYLEERKYAFIRRFTFRKGCLNPAVGIAFQFFAAISHGEITIFFQIFGICLGSIVGGLAAAWFYNSFYEPLLNELEEGNEK